MSEHIESDIDFLIDDVTGAITGHMSGGAGPSKRVGIPTTPKGCTSPYILAQSGIPVILSSSATAISATGAVSVATALPYVPPGVCQVFMFLASSGGANQLYYARYSSTTAFQLYLDAAGTITPTGLTAGAYAGGTSEATLASITVPGGAIGASGSLQIDKQSSVVNNANTKTLREYFSGNLTESIALTSQPGITTTKHFQNRGEGYQIRTSSWPTGYGYVAASTNSVDTTQTTTLAITAQVLTASDYMILERYRAVISPGA